MSRELKVVSSTLARVSLEIGQSSWSTGRYVLKR